MLIADFTAAADAAFDRDDTLYVCEYCVTAVPRNAIVCPDCGDFHYIMSVQDWEATTGEVWED